jgi:hypothetical protein
MWRRFWEGLDLSKPDAPELIREHDERCPFCGRTFDWRDPSQVLQHYDHQLAAGAPPANDPIVEEDEPLGLRKVILFKLKRPRSKL